MNPVMATVLSLGLVRHTYCGSRICMSRQTKEESSRTSKLMTSGNVVKLGRPF